MSTPNSTTPQLSAEQAAKLLTAYIVKFGTHLCDGRRTLTLNTASLRYINARIREWKRSLENEKNDGKSSLSTWLWNTFYSSSSNQLLSQSDCELLQNFFKSVPVVRIQGNRTDSEIDLSLFQSLSTLELSNCKIVFAKGCHQITNLHCIESQISDFNLFYKVDNSDVLNPPSPSTVSPQMLPSGETNVSTALKHLTLSFIVEDEHTDDYDDDTDSHHAFIFEKWMNGLSEDTNNLMTEHLETLIIQKLTPVPEWFVPISRHETTQHELPVLRSLKTILQTNIWSSLTKLVCNHCGFTFVIENPLSGDNGDVIYSHALKSAPILRELILSSNNIKSILEDPNSSCGNFDSDELVLGIRDLDLSNNKLRSNSGSFKFFDRLFLNIRTLNLSNNRLTQIADICCLSMLQILNLSNNRISDWSEVETLQQLLELQELWLEGNAGLQANTNYRSYACGFFGHLPKLIFDGKLASKWELNYHVNAYGQKRKSTSSHTPDADYSDYKPKKTNLSSSSSDDDTLLQQTPGTFAVVSTVPDMLNSEEHVSNSVKATSSQKSDKKKKKKKKKRTVDSIPVLPASIKKGKQVEQPNSVDSVGSDPMKVTSETQPKEIAIVKPSKPSSIQQHLEALKKDGGDQWLLILNEYMTDANQPSRKSSTAQPVDILPTSVTKSKSVEQRSRSHSSLESEPLDHNGKKKQKKQLEDPKKIAARGKKKKVNESKILERLINEASESDEEENLTSSSPSTASPSNPVLNLHQGTNPVDDSTSERRSTPPNDEQPLPTENKQQAEENIDDIEKNIPLRPVRHRRSAIPSSTTIMHQMRAKEIDDKEREKHTIEEDEIIKSIISDTAWSNLSDGESDSDEDDILNELLNKTGQNSPDDSKVVVSSTTAHTQQPEQKTAKIVIPRKGSTIRSLQGTAAEDQIQVNSVLYSTSSSYSDDVNQFQMEEDIKSNNEDINSDEYESYDEDEVTFVDDEPQLAIPQQKIDVEAILNQDEDQIDVNEFGTSFDFRVTTIPVQFSRTALRHENYMQEEYCSFFINDSFSVFKSDDGEEVIKRRGTHYFRLRSLTVSTSVSKYTLLHLDERSAAKDIWRTLICLELGADNTIRGKERLSHFPTVITSEDGETSRIEHQDRFANIFTTPSPAESIIYRVTCTEMQNLGFIARTFPTIVRDYILNQQAQLSLELLTDNLNTVFRQQFELKNKQGSELPTFSLQSVRDIISRNEVFFKKPEKVNSRYDTAKQEQQQMRKMKVEQAKHIFKSLDSSLKPLYSLMISEMQNKSIGLFDVDSRMRSGLTPLPINQEHWAVHCSLNVLTGSAETEHDETFLHVMYSNYILRESDLDFVTSYYSDNRKLAAVKRSSVGGVGDEISVIIIMSNMHFYILHDLNYKDSSSITQHQPIQLTILAKHNILQLQQAHLGYNSQYVQLDFGEPQTGKSISYLLLTRSSASTNQIIKYLMHSLTDAFKIFNYSDYSFFGRLRIHEYDQEFEQSWQLFVKDALAASIQSSSNFISSATTGANDPTQIKAMYSGFLIAYDEDDLLCFPTASSLRNLPLSTYPANAYGKGTRLCAPISLGIMSEYVVIYAESYSAWPMALLTKQYKSMFAPKASERVSNIQKLARFGTNVLSIIFDTGDDGEEDGKQWIFGFQDKAECDACIKTICHAWTQIFHIDLEIESSAHGARPIRQLSNSERRRRGGSVHSGTPPPEESVLSTSGSSVPKIFNLFALGKKKQAALSNNSSITPSTSPSTTSHSISPSSPPVSSTVSVNLEDEESIKRLQARRRARRNSSKYM